MNPVGGMTTANQMTIDWAGAGARPDVAGEAMDYLESARQLERGELFSSYCHWRHGVDEERGEGDRFLTELEVLRDHPSSDDATVTLVQEAIDKLGGGRVESMLPLDSPHASLAQSYVDDLLAGDRAAATRRILGAVESGLSIRDLYLDVFEPVLGDIGYRWETNQISVGQEHYCTAVTQSIMAQLFPYIFSSSLKSRRLVATSVAGNLHEIGIRMVADLFELSGWDTHYLGANTPVADLVTSLRELEPDAVAISVMLTSQITAAGETIAAIRADDRLRDVLVIVGGRALRLEPDLADRLGADAWAVDPEQAAALVDQMLEER
jgi:methanogenic corrinoid protein MtbC1